ncbi:MAG: hypothetical protein AAFV45_10655 [Pseudomonadota bacterium]
MPSDTTGACGASDVVADTFDVPGSLLSGDVRSSCNLELSGKSRSSDAFRSFDISKAPLGYVPGPSQIGFVSGPPDDQVLLAPKDVASHNTFSGQAETLQRLRAAIQRIEGSGARSRPVRTSHAVTTAGCTEGACGTAAGSTGVVGTGAVAPPPSSALPISADAVPHPPMFGAVACSPDLRGAGHSKLSIPRDAHRGWCLGEPQIDQRLGPGGLHVGGVHEIKPDVGTAPGALAGVVATTLSFAWRLALRRVSTGDFSRSDPCGISQAAPDAGRPVLWCTTQAHSSEYGGLYGPGLFYGSGLVQSGFDHAQLLVVRARRADDVLWAVEEALRAGAVGAVIAHLDDVDLTPARRLSLAAQSGQTPCLMVTRHDTSGMAATASRWRVGSVAFSGSRSRLESESAHAGAGSAADPCAGPGLFPSQVVDAGRYSGAGLCQVRLERCRQHVSAGASPPLVLEWSDETLSFGLVSALADGAARACPTPRRSRC